MSIDKVTDAVSIGSMSATNKSTDKAKMVRELKAQGLTWQEIADRTGIKKQTAHYHGRPRPGERICPCCCRPLKPVKPIK